jgi:hypothetical protein
VGLSVEGGKVDQILRKNHLKWVLKGDEAAELAGEKDREMRAFDLQRNFLYARL